MGVEIEKKFLLKNDEWRKLIHSSHIIKQGYFQKSEELTIRLRVKDDQAYLTFKGEKKNSAGLEYEFMIPTTEAEEMFQNFPLQGKMIHKIRHHVFIDGFIFEIDEFKGDHQGLIVAEIELEDVSQEHPTPEWLGDEVTKDPKYYNANLAQS